MSRIDIHTHTERHICTDIHTHTETYMHRHTHTHTHRHTHRHICTDTKHTQTEIYVHRHTHTHEINNRFEISTLCHYIYTTSKVCHSAMLGDPWASPCARVSTCHGVCVSMHFKLSPLVCSQAQPL